MPTRQYNFDTLQFQASRDLLGDAKPVNMFGSNSAIALGNEDVWMQGGEYVYTDSAGADYYFSSSDNSDTQPIKIHILLTDDYGNWYDGVITQQLAGQTKTKIVVPDDLKPVRIFRAENDGNEDLAGTCYVYEDDTVVSGVPQTANKIRLSFNGDNQSLMAIYTVPTGFVGFLFRGEAGLLFSSGPSATDYAKVQYKSRNFGKAFKVKKQVSLVTTGESIFQDQRSFPDVIPAKTDVKIHVKEVSSAMGVWAAFDILLVPEDHFDNEYLDAIGQIREVVE